MEPINIQFQHTKESLKRSIIQVYNSGSRKSLRWLGYFLIIMAVVNVIMNTCTQFRNNVRGTFIALLILGLYFSFNSYIIAFFTIKRLKPTDPLYEPINYTFDEDGFEIKGDSFQSLHTWDKVDNIVEKEDCLLIFIRKSMAHYVPKDAFNAGDFEKLKVGLEGLSYLKTNFF